MNIFFKINGEYITPSLDGSILAGITRKSVIELIKDRGYKITERPITIHEIIEAEENGTLEEAFGTGTAVAITMIKEIAFRDKIIKVSDDNPVAEAILKIFNEIRTGKMEDKFNWMVRLEKELV